MQLNTFFTGRNTPAVKSHPLLTNTFMLRTYIIPVFKYFMRYFHVFGQMLFHYGSERHCKVHVAVTCIFITFL